jgi:hypothetical protein
MTSVSIQLLLEETKCSAIRLWHLENGHPLPFFDQLRQDERVDRRPLVTRVQGRRRRQQQQQQGRHH